VTERKTDEKDNLFEAHAAKGDFDGISLSYLNRETIKNIIFVTD
jgi:hypothetical protein